MLAFMPSSWRSEICSYRAACFTGLASVGIHWASKEMSSCEDDQVSEVREQNRAAQGSQSMLRERRQSCWFPSALDQVLRLGR